MKIGLIAIIIFLSFINLIKNDLPTFRVKGVNNTETLCYNDKGYFQFVILGEGTGISEEIRVILPLESPEECKAVCMVNSKKIFCKMDALIYDLTGQKKLKVFEETPEFDNLILLDWNKTFSSDHSTLNDATNCDPKERKIDPGEEDEEHIFAASDTKSINIVGCFGKKNNFNFQLTKIKDEKRGSDESFEQDIYFEISLKKPEGKKALCVMPKNNNNDIYTFRCAIDYGGEIEIGEETSGIAKLEDKKIKIVIRGLLISPTIVDECTEDKNNF